ncbi:MAG: hypothetical protein BACA_03549 [Bacteroides fragilis]
MLFLIDHLNISDFFMSGNIELKVTQNLFMLCECVAKF